MYHYAAYERDRVEAADGQATARARTRSTTCSAAEFSSTCTGSCARACASASSRTRSRSSSRCTWPPRRRDHRRGVEHRRVRALARDPRPQILDDIEATTATTSSRPGVCTTGWRRAAAEAEQQSSRPPERPVAPDRRDALDDDSGRIVDLAVRLAGRPARSTADRSSDTDDHARWVLAAPVAVARREDKPEWWRFFDIVIGYATRRPDRRQGLPRPSRRTSASMVPRRIRCCTATGSTPSRSTRSRSAIGRRIRPSSATSCSSVSVAWSPARWSRSTRSRASSSSSGPATPPRCIRSRSMDHNVIGTMVLRDAIARVADWSVANGIDASGALPGGARPAPRRCAADPRRGDRSGLATTGEDAVAAATRLVRGLDRSCLPIQGPPDTGKTFTSAARHRRLRSLPESEWASPPTATPSSRTFSTRRCAGGDAKGRRHHGDAHASMVGAAPIPT